MSLDTVVQIYSNPDPISALRHKIQDNPIILQAIYVASKDLYDTADTWLAGSEVDDKVALRILAYVSRLSYRPTPMGLFAGIGKVSVDATTTLSVDTNGRVTAIRPDMGLLSSIMRSVEGGAQKGKVSYVTNAAAFSFGNRLYVTNILLMKSEKTADGTISKQAPVSMRHVPAVEFLRQIAANGRLYEDLVSALCDRFGCESIEAESLLDKMIESGVLLSEFRVTPAGASISAILQRLDSVDGATCAPLLDGARLAARLDRLPLDHRDISDFKTVACHFTQAQPEYRGPAIQVDLSSPFLGTLNQRVLDDAAKLADMWRRMSPVAEMSAFRSRFERRYEGSERVVPLLTLLDPDVGLGSPEPLEFTRTDGPRRDSTLLRIASDALRTGLTEVDLTLADLEILAPKRSDAEEHSDGDFGFQVWGESPSAIDRGDYFIAPSSFIAAQPAGASLGRFAHLFDETVLRELRHVACKEATGFVAAELVFTPSEPRAYNVLIRPQLLEAEIRIGVGSPSDRNTIELSDLWVGLEDGRFFLWSESKRCRILPFEHHLFSTERYGSNIGRFLAALRQDGRRSLGAFDWGAAARFGYLPRVRVGNLVLSLRRWFLSSQQVVAAFFQGEAGYRRWWRDWNVPRYVTVGEGDNYLLVDLESTVALPLIRDICRAKKAIIVREALPDPRLAWTPDRSGGTYVVDFVATLPASDNTHTSDPATKGTPRASSRDVVTVTARRSFGPGSAWLYAQVGVPVQATDDLLTRDVANFVDDVRERRMLGSWYFVRYAVLGPSLRLRFKAASPDYAQAIRERFIALAESWLEADLVHDYSLGTYEPEYERFGGPASFSLVEDIFQIDSDTCVSILQNSRAESPSRSSLAAESFCTLLRSNDLVEAAISLIDVGADRTLSAEERSQTRRSSERLLSNEYPRIELDEPHSAMLLRYMSHFVHLHCNRMSVGSDDEPRMRAMLRSLCLSLVRREPSTHRRSNVIVERP